MVNKRLIRASHVHLKSAIACSRGRCSRWRSTHSRCTERCGMALCRDRRAGALIAPAVGIPSWPARSASRPGARVGCLERRALRHRSSVGGDRQPHLLTFPLQPLKLLGFCFLCALCDPHLAVPSEFEILAPSQWLDKERKARRHFTVDGAVPRLCYRQFFALL